MISQEKCKKIVDLAVSHGRKRKADGVEVTITGSNIATSRFAINGMTQNQCPDTVRISVRVIKDGKQARQNTDNYSEKGIRQVVDDALLSASMLERDSSLIALPSAKLVREMSRKIGVKPISRYQRKTALMTADQRADIIRSVIDLAESQKLESAGVYASGMWFTALGNSHGVFQYHIESSAEFSVTMDHNGASGWAKAQGIAMGEFEPLKLAQQAAATALRSRNPRELAPGRYTAILPPTAVLDLLCFLNGDFSATSHLDKLSSLTDKVGKKVFGDNITIVDDAYHALSAGAPFDGEGLPRMPVTLVENGVVTNLVHSRVSAAKMGATPTGHSLQQPSAMGDYALNPVIAGGTASMEEMIRTTDKGVLLSRVWYVRTVDPETVLLTGMTRDGTFCVEGGEVAYPIRNFRFNVSVHELLNNVLALGPAVRAAGEESTPNVVPAMKVAGFNFTEVTKF